MSSKVAVSLMGGTLELEMPLLLTDFEVRLTTPLTHKVRIATRGFYMKGFKGTAAGRWRNWLSPTSCGSRVRRGDRSAQYRAEDGMTYIYQTTPAPDLPFIIEKPKEAIHV